MNGTVDVANNKITLTGIGAFSLWTAADNDNPLPVELTSFTASTTPNGQAGNTVTLNWETKTEVMNQGFEVERKIGTTGWEKIGFVEGHNTSNSPKYYSFIDRPTVSGKIFYSLKQIDTDGSYEYSNELSVETGLPTEFALGQNYPNPFSAGANGNPGTVVRYALPAAGEVSIKVYNSLGQEVLTLVDGVKEAGNHSISFDAATYKLTSGVYFYRLSAGGVSITKKMVLMR